MEKIVTMRSLYRSIYRRSLGFSTAATATATTSNQHHLSRGLRCFHLPTVAKRLTPDFRSPLSSSMNIGSRRYFSHMPAINDREIETVVKDLMAASWDELPNAVIHYANKALSKNTEDKVGQKILANILRAAEAVEEFTGKLVSLRMEIDDNLGLSGENVRTLPYEFVKALNTAFERYTAYLEAFGPDETFLRKKVENELGTRMIHLKIRCGGLGSEWGKVTVLGTSRLSGSYVEHRVDNLNILSLDVMFS